MKTLPSLFVSHGAPSFALKPDRAGANLKRVGQKLPDIEAVVVISPHWMTEGLSVTASPSPRTLHDFSGFEPELYQLQYPAPGDPALARRIVDLLARHEWKASMDPDRGLDHGAWVPLLHLLPAAGAPVLQVSLPASLDAEGAYALGQALAPLRKAGVLIIGSGSLTHNLYEVFNGSEDCRYAEQFAAWIRQAVATGDHASLKFALDLAPHARRAHPTPEHYWPLLVAAGAGSPGPATVLEGGMSYEVLCMDAFVFGGQQLAWDSHPALPAAPQAQQS